MQLKIKQWKIPKRFVIVIMVFIGYINFYYLHANIAMAVVDMTSAKRILQETGTLQWQKPEFDWNSMQKGLVLSSFAYGRLLGPIGGVLAGRLGGSTLYGIGTLLTALITLLTPLMLKIDFYLFVIATALTGTFESFAYSSVSEIWSRWAPPDERAKCISFSIIGIYGGSIVSFIVAGWILFIWGWAVLFYASGIASFLWFWIWCLVVKNDPSDDKHMSEDERKYIKEKLSSNVSPIEKLEFPWRRILTSVPVWAACLCKFATGCGFTFSIMYLPQYIKDINDIDIKSIGYIAVIPQICGAIAMPLAGCISDYIRSNNLLSLTNLHKLYICIGTSSGAIGFAVAGLWPNFTAAIIFISLYQFFGAFLVLDIQILVLDLAPRYAALLNAFANSFLTAASFLTPIFVGFCVTSHSQFQWSICFLTISVIIAIIELIFLKFGSGELQPWANYTSNKHCKNTVKNEDLSKHFKC